MQTETQFFKEQENDANSTGYLWNGRIANILAEGTWDGATLKMQVQYTSSGEWVDFLTFTADDFAIIKNLLPGFNIRFNVSGAGLSTSLTVNMLKA